MAAPELIETIEGQGFPNVYIYTYRGVTFGTHRTWRSSPVGWDVGERRDGKWLHPGNGGINMGGYYMPRTRKAAIDNATWAIDRALDKKED